MPSSTATTSTTSTTATATPRTTGTTTITDSGYRPNPAPATGTASRVLARCTVAGREFILRRTRIEPGGQSGWHYHDGTLFVLVTGGDLDHPGLDCAPVTHKRGRIFREPSGAEHAHLARNLGPNPVKLTVLYVNPAGHPLARGVPPPPCAT